MYLDILNISGSIFAFAILSTLTYIVYNICCIEKILGIVIQNKSQHTFILPRILDIMITFILSVFKLFYYLLRYVFCDVYLKFGKYELVSRVLPEMKISSETSILLDLIDKRYWDVFYSSYESFKTFSTYIDNIDMINSASEQLQVCFDILYASHSQTYWIKCKLVNYPSLQFHLLQMHQLAWNNAEFFDHYSNMTKMHKSEILEHMNHNLCIHIQKACDNKLSIQLTKIILNYDLSN